MVTINWNDIIGGFTNQLHNISAIQPINTVYYDSISQEVDDDILKCVPQVILDALICVEAKKIIPQETLNLRIYNHHDMLKANILASYTQCTNDPADTVLTVHDFRQWVTQSNLRQFVTGLSNQMYAAALADAKSPSSTCAPSLTMVNQFHLIDTSDSSTTTISDTRLATSAARHMASNNNTPVPAAAAPISSEVASNTTVSSIAITTAAEPVSDAPLLAASALLSPGRFPLLPLSSTADNAAKIAARSTLMHTLLNHAVIDEDCQKLITRVIKRIIEHYLASCPPVEHVVIDYPSRCSEDDSIISISWADVLKAFELRYDEIFLAKDAKAHFDFCPLIVDGAKERWRSLLMLDAIVCYANAHQPFGPHYGRRSFDQHTALKESILEVYARQYGEACPTTYVNADRTGVTQIGFPWNSLFNLRMSFWVGETRKSLKKRAAIVEALCETPVVKERDLPDVIKNITDNILHNIPIPTAPNKDTISGNLNVFCNTILQLTHKTNNSSRSRSGRAKISNSNTYDAESVESMREKLKDFCTSFLMLANCDEGDEPTNYIDIMELANMNNEITQIPSDMDESYDIQENDNSIVRNHSHKHENRQEECSSHDDSISDGYKWQRESVATPAKRVKPAVSAEDAAVAAAIVDQFGMTTRRQSRR